MLSTGVIPLARRVLLPILVLLGAYLFGFLGSAYEVWPGPRFADAVRTLKFYMPFGSQNQDQFGRLRRYQGKVEIPCPAQDSETAVFVVAGQSNSANHGGQRFQSVTGQVLNYFEGRCFLASSPFLGAEGILGESWTLLGHRLVQANVYHRVIFIPAGVGNTPMSRWAQGGDLNRMLDSVVRDAKAHYTIDGVLWHQGETDYRLRTAKDAYETQLRSLISSIRSAGVLAPIYISAASYEERYTDWTPANPIVDAQRSVVDGSGVFAGPNTDIIGAADRYDGTHFSSSGQEKFADQWFEILSRKKAGARPIAAAPAAKDQ
jgi:Carbohydrate esterase, sialic acid-specific acetylesterase